MIATMKKGLFIKIINIVIPVFISLLIFVFAKIPYYPKPVETSKLPSYIRWNYYIGEYYNSKVFKWKPMLKDYIQINPPTEIIDSRPFANDTLKQWKETHRYSKDLLDKKIIVATEKIDSGLGRYSCYTRDMVKLDKRLKYIAKLGIKEIPNMLQHIKNESEIASVLSETICIMTNTASGHIRLSDEGRRIWLLNYVNKVKNSENIMKITYNRLKLEINPEVKSKIKKEIAEVGIWGLTYALDEYKKGNEALLNIFKEEYGEDFIKMNIDEIEYIRKIIISEALEDTEERTDNFWVYPEAVEHQ